MEKRLYFIINLFLLAITHGEQLMAREYHVFTEDVKHEMQTLGNANLLVFSEIVEQADKILQTQSKESRLAEKKKLVSLLKKEQLNADTHKKIINAIEIILKTVDETLDSSIDAYQFLRKFFDLQFEQQKLIAKAQQIKNQLLSSSGKVRQEIVDEGLNALKAEIKIAQKKIDSALATLDTMMESAQESVDKTIVLLKQIVDLAAKVVHAKNEPQRLKAKEKLADLMTQELDSKTKNAIAADIQIIQNAMPQTINEAQKAYDRLLKMIDLAEHNVEEILDTLEEGKELVESSSGMMQTARDFVSSKLKNISNVFERLAFSAFEKTLYTYEDKQKLHKEQLNHLLYRIARSKNKEVRNQDEITFKNILQRSDLDLSIKNALQDISDKIDQGVKITLYDIHKSNLGLIMRYELLSSIIQSLPEIVYNPNSSQAQKDKKNIIDLMAENMLYQKTKDAIADDMKIILEANDTTKQDALLALKRVTEILKNSKPTDGFLHTISSKIPESVKRISRDYPYLAGASLGLGFVLGNEITRHLLSKYKAWMNNYEDLKKTGDIFANIAETMLVAKEEGDETKYHILMGIFEGLGIKVKEIEATTEGFTERMDLYLPKKVTPSKRFHKNP